MDDKDVKDGDDGADTGRRRRGRARGARKGTAAEMTGTAARIGDAAIEIPRSGTATTGAAAGAGLSGGAADPRPPGAADPGGDGDLTGDVPASTEREGGGSALGETRAGGKLLEFDAAFRNRDNSGE